MKIFFIFLLSVILVRLDAQDTTSETKNEFNLGVGIGMDYGGIGVRGTFLPIQRLGLFSSAGYNLNAFGFNAGAQWLFPKRRHAFYLTGMYGYNGVLIVTGELSGKGTYYGVSLGVGYQLKVGSNRNFWNWEVLVPFRSGNFYDDYDTLKNLGQQPGNILPVTVSVGYHFRIRT